MAYPDPKIVTVAAPINEVTRLAHPPAHPHTQRRELDPTSSSTGAVNTAPSADELARLRPYLVDLTDGVFSTTGAATTSASDVDAIMDVHLPAFVAAHGPGVSVLHACSTWP